jgi:hypothetical protein
MEGSFHEGSEDLEEALGALDDDDLRAVAKNVGKLFRWLPQRAWLKLPLMDALLGDVSLDAAVALTGLKRNTISKAAGWRRSALQLTM